MNYVICVKTCVTVKDVCPKKASHFLLPNKLGVSKCNFVLTSVFSSFVVQECFIREWENEKGVSRKRICNKFTVCNTESSSQTPWWPNIDLCDDSFYYQYCPGHVWSFCSTYFDPKWESLTCVKLILLLEVSRNWLCQDMRQDLSTFISHPISTFLHIYCLKTGPVFGLIFFRTPDATHYCSLLYCTCQSLHKHLSKYVLNFYNDTSYRWISYWLQ